MGHNASTLVRICLSCSSWLDDCPVVSGVLLLCIKNSCNAASTVNGDLDMDFLFCFISCILPLLLIYLRFIIILTVIVTDCML